MNCPQCDLPLNIEDIVNEHAEDYGFVKLRSVEELEKILEQSDHVPRLFARDLAITLHSALQGNKHA